MCLSPVVTPPPIDTPGGGYSAAKLRNLTHSEAPWLNAEGRADNTITTESMRTFFPTLLEETA